MMCVVNQSRDSARAGVKEKTGALNWSARWRVDMTPLRDQNRRFLQDITARWTGGQTAPSTLSLSSCALLIIT